MPARLRVDSRHKGKAILYRAVHELGLTPRQSISAVDTVIAQWREALKRHEDVELPVGVLKVRKGPAPKRVFRRGRLKNTKRSLFDIFRQPYTVRLLEPKGLEN